MSDAPIDRGRLVPLAIIGLILVFALPELGLAKLLFGDTPIGARVGREIIWVGFGLGVLLWVTKVERLPLASIGLVRPTRGTFGWGLAATVALIASVMLSFAVIAPALGMKQNMQATAAIVQVPLWLLITTPIVAGITEELLYRGYAIERLSFLTGNRWLAGLIAGGMFLLLHAAWGGIQMIIVAFGTVIFVGLYLWRHDLPCVMLAHILADLTGFALARAQM
jgi:uncharacterized protein